MRLAKQDDNKIVVAIKTAARDPKTQKIKYATVDSFDVYEATGTEVKEAVLRGLNSASAAKK